MCMRMDSPGSSPRAAWWSSSRKAAFATNDGAANAEKSQGFNVIGQATTFEIIIEGAIALYIPFVNEELFAIEGKVVVSTSMAASEARIMLEAQGSIRVIYLGTIASAAAKLVLAIPKVGDPQLWGVVNLEANFAKLLAIGIDLDVFAELKLNMTSETKTERLALPVMQGSITDEITRTLDSLAFPAATRTEFENQRLPLSGNVKCYCDRSWTTVADSLTKTGNRISTRWKKSSTISGRTNSPSFKTRNSSCRRGSSASRWLASWFWASPIPTGLPLRRNTSA